MKGGEGRVCWVEPVYMWQHCSLTGVQRKTAFVEEWWWPEFDMFGSMPWCSFPWHKLLTRLTQQNCFIVYRLNLIHEFTSFFSTKVILQVCLRRPSRGNRPLYTASKCQDSPKASPRAIIKWKNLIEPLKHLLEGMLYERWRRLRVLSSTCQHVAISVLEQTHLPSVATHGDEYDWICIIIICVSLWFGKQCCAEKDSLCGRVMIAWIWHVWINAMVFLPMVQAPHKADATELLYCLPSKFDP